MAKKEEKEKYSLCFYHPEPFIDKKTILPFFMPFAGCSLRCVFCVQDIQTGKFSLSVEALLQELDESLKSRANLHCLPCEVAFYGGTFTALPWNIQEAFLRITKKWQKSNVVGAVRCSTRPDAIDQNNLLLLKEYGVSCIELGVQSFNEPALTLSCRGYTKNVVVDAAAAIQQAGIKLGIQLMPGMPGVCVDIANDDIEKALLLQPDFLRLYPCLVIKGAELAMWWQKGVYIPWNIEETVQFLSKALLRCWEKSVPVIRMGVASTPLLDENILAGPVHPALGAIARSRALYLLLENNVFLLLDNARLIDKKVPSIALAAPRRYQGEFFGHKGELKDAYAQLGIVPANIVWHEKEGFVLSLLQ